MKRAVASLAVVILVSSLAFGDDSGVYQPLDEAQKKEGAGDVDGAMAEYTQGIAQYTDPFTLSACYLGRGMLKNQKGDFDGAIADLTKATDLSPTMDVAFGELGLVRIEQGDWNDAIAAITKAINLKPANSSYYEGRAHAEKMKGDLTGAIADYTKVIELEPTGQNYTNRGIVFYAENDLRDALGDFQKEIGLDSGGGGPDYGHFYVWEFRTFLGEADAATQELRDYWAARKFGTPTDWPSQIEAFLTDQLAEADFLKAAVNSDKATDAEQHCEAYFYAGLKREFAGDKSSAAIDFGKSVATGQTRSIIYTSSTIEVKYLNRARK